MFKGNSKNSAHSAPCFWILGTRYNEHFKSDFIQCLVGLAWLGLAPYFYFNFNFNSIIFSSNKISVHKYIIQITNQFHFLHCAFNVHLGILGGLAGLHWLGTCLVRAPVLVTQFLLNNLLGAPPLTRGRLLQPNYILKYTNLYINFRKQQYLIIHVISQVKSAGQLGSCLRYLARLLSSPGAANT